MNYDDPYENEDVEVVFKAHDAQTRKEMLSAMWITLEQLSHMTHYDPEEWEDIRGPQ